MNAAALGSADEGLRLRKSKSRKTVIPTEGK